MSSVLPESHTHNPNARKPLRWLIAIAAIIAVALIAWFSYTNSFASSDDIAADNNYRVEVSASVITPTPSTKW